MDRTRHARITELFGEVCDLPPEVRARRLREACGDDPSLIADVESLLLAEVKPVLRAPALGEGFSLTGTAGGMREPGEGEPVIARRFGAYTVRRCINAGGMAVVYEAEQEHPHRVVALKVLRGGLLSRSALKRFHLESEVLGRLQHPGIARIYDAGMHREAASPEGAPGLPYFAMELIDGSPITRYAREHGLDLRGRMELVARVCDAVQHAHQHGVIHRDLKPANILVDQTGQPKILDFGVARATDSDLLVTTLHTEAGQLVGTIPYMSPEQVVGDPAGVDTRSDVYALGVILYELLGGRLPYPVTETAIPEAARLIREQEPATLASIDRALRGDPSTIAARALEKDKSRRYQSAAELGADIQRFLTHEPIVARPASTLYQLGKMARRKKGVFVAAGLAVLTLIAATAVSVRLAVEAERARARAVGALSETEGVSEYLLDLFLESPDQATINRQQLLERAEQRLAGKPVREPRVEAKVREYIGHGWNKLNYGDLAEPHLARALEIRRALGTRDADMVKSLHLMAMQRFGQGRVPEGQGLLREALAARRELLGADHMTTVPDEELLYFAVVYTPEAPEAAQEFERRRLLREQAPVPVAGAVQGEIVLEDDFEGESLDPAWKVELLRCQGWTHAVGGSRLTVTDLEPPVRPSGPDESTHAWVRLSRRLPAALGDFRVEARLGWDSEDRLEAIQNLSVRLFGPGRHTITVEGYDDQWLQYRGGRGAQVGREGAPLRAVNSGWDSLPARGAANLTIERLGERITAYWDGHELVRGLSSDPLVEVAFDFVWTVHAGANGESFFGREWIDSIRVRGTPAPASTPR